MSPRVDQNPGRNESIGRQSAPHHENTKQALEPAGIETGGVGGDRRAERRRGGLAPRGPPDRQQIAKVDAQVAVQPRLRGLSRRRGERPAHASVEGRLRRTARTKAPPEALDLVQCILRVEC